jgi:cytidine deaminase
MHRETLSATVEYYSLAELVEAERELVVAARKATSNSHSPYSKFRVGAAVRLSSGLIVMGANQENAAYPMCICAERVALNTVGGMGNKKDVVALAVTGRLGTVDENVYRGTDPLTPCGGCRQVIKEYEDLAGKPFVLLMDGYCDVVRRMVGVESLLPFSFGPSAFGADALA